MAQKQHVVPQTKHRLTTIVSIDVCDFSAIAEIDEVSALIAVERLSNDFKAIAEDFSGSVFHEAGDGFLAEFSSVHNALLAGTEILKRNNDIPTGSSPNLDLRVGIHVGDIVAKSDGDLMGHCVNVAAGLQSHCRRNCILVSSQVFNLVNNKINGFSVRPESLYIKNMRTPLTVYDLNPLAIKHRASYYAVLRLKTKNKLPLIFGTLALIMCFFLGVGMYDTYSKDSFDEHLQTIIETHFSKYSSSIDSVHLTDILRDLSQSDINSDRLALTLIKDGNLSNAISVLEGSLENSAKHGQEYLEILFQIGAIKYQTDPTKAIATYETILVIDSANYQANVRLGRAYDIVGDIEKATIQYNRALELPSPSEIDLIRLKLDIAFNDTIRGEPQKALTLLDEVDQQLKSMPNRLKTLDLVSKVKTERAIVLERLDRLDEAEGTVISIMALQKKNNLLYDLARCHNVLGQVFEKRASQITSNNFEKAQNYYQRAYDQYSAQVDLDKQLNKQHGLAEGLYYRGQVSRKLQQHQNAKTDLLNSLRISKEYDITNSEFLALIGLAQIKMQFGEHKETCEYVDRLQKLYDTRVSAELGPITRTNIESLGCGFIF